MQHYRNRITDLSDLRDFIYTKLCEHNDFALGAFQTSERILIRAGEPCGVYFCLHGPRSLKLTAIWETDKNSILFYGEHGERLQRVQLSHNVSLEPVAA